MEGTMRTQRALHEVTVGIDQGPRLNERDLWLHIHPSCLMVSFVHSVVHWGGNRGKTSTMDLCEVSFISYIFSTRSALTLTID